MRENENQVDFLLTSSSILRISPLVGEECLDHLLEGPAELAAEFIADVFLEGNFESMLTSDVFLESLDIVPFCFSKDIFRSILSSLSL